MDYTFTAEDEAFRNEVRTFLMREIPAWWDDVQDIREFPEAYEFYKQFRKKLAAKGWLAMAWPKEYGGQSATVFQQMIFSEETAYFGAPAGGQGVAWVGPAILIYGTEEQKKKYLRAITGAEIDFCTLYTEPGAGSDLASLVTRARRDGDEYVVSGQKIFNGGADLADYGWLAARTNPDAPKHRGISLFVLDMKTPGITVRPMKTMSGYATHPEVFLDDVRIPKENLVGEENRGWYQMAVSLDFERSGASRAAAAKRVLEDLVTYAKTTRRNGHTLAKEPGVRSRLAQVAIEIDVSRYISYRIASLQQAGKPFSNEASTGKVFGTELTLRIENVAMQIMGLYGQMFKGSKHAQMGGRRTFEYLNCWGGMFGAGTAEIQRTIIATRGLGLPRGD
ncbi:MAG: acyl-CoA dehydrogenase family protein [Chloroflexi bacterium]|nr:acyl-CoA dehydrogenase family protein [Chloroflexota bacterium]